MKPLLEVTDLAVSFQTPAGKVRAVNNVSFAVHAGEAIGIVGESGCGKSVTAHSIMRLVATPPGHYENGQILFDGQDLLTLTEDAMQSIRGNQISMIFQDPMTSLNPVLTVGRQVAEALERHRRYDRRQAQDKAVELLRSVGIPSPEQRSRNYPHQFSGGMRQRAMIAMALACSPKLLIADEPTTALDVTIQAQIVDLLRELKRTTGTAIILISHDLGVVASLCSRVLVMYAGRIVEAGTAEDIFHHPCHPYTWGLLQSMPRLDAPRKEALAVIEGQPPDLLNPPAGCPFHTRCPYAMRICTGEMPAATQPRSGQSVKCWLQHPQAPKLCKKAAD